MSPPSSTGAINGSVKSSTHSTSSNGKADPKSTANLNHNSGFSSFVESSLASSSPKDLSDASNADYLANTTNAVPRYQYSSTKESVRSHTTSMKSYLEDFDNNMAKYEA